MAKTNGSIIGPANIPTGAFGSAPGVWKLSEAEQYKKEGIWPVATTGFQVANSLRFDDGSTDYLDRTCSDSGGNITTATISFWIKRAALGSAMTVFAGNYTINNNFSCRVRFTGSDQLNFYNYDNAINCQYTTNRVFRDVSSWYHIVFELDQTLATAADRVKIYVNGVQETSFATETTMSGDQWLLGKNSSYENVIGQVQSTDYLDGYISEFYYIEGTAHDADVFGETDTTTGNWIPKDVSGLTFGNNGFYLPFQNAAALGQDDSGNGNDFTVNNLTSIDQCIDSPTNNFATLNPLVKNTFSSGGFSLSEGNLKVSPTSLYYDVPSTLAVSSGKWYWEAKMITSIANENTPSMGVTDIDKANFTQYLYLNNPGTCYTYGATGVKTSDINGSTSNTSYGDTFSQNDIIGCALDLDNGFIYFSKNGTWQNSGDPESGASGTGAAFSSVSGNFASLVRDYSSGNAPEWQYNFGNAPFTISSGNTDFSALGNFEYEVPSGYRALCTKNIGLVG